MDISIINVPASAKVDLIKWAEIVIEKWEFNLASRDLVHSGTLINGFTAHVSTEASGNRALISFAFQYYIRMIDMGVGKGVTRDEVATLGESRKVHGIKTGNRRRRIPVYSKTMYAEIMRLGELLAEKYAERGAGVVIEGGG